jgi:hypothetical protein
MHRRQVRSSNGNDWSWLEPYLSEIWNYLQNNMPPSSATSQSPISFTFRQPGATTMKPKSTTMKYPGVGIGGTGTAKSSKH